MASKDVSDWINYSVIVVDKHAGPTSHQVSGWLRDMLGLKKVGHTGTLDPMVTGVLPILLGDCVKAMPLFSGSHKEYVGVMHLHHEVPREKIDQVVSEFIGKISQRPPKKSAVARREREREIFEFEILDVDGNDILFRTKTEAGTYIRKLCHDMGQRMGVGAHMAELRRTKAGVFNESHAHSLMEVKDALEMAKNGDASMIEKIAIPIERGLGNAKKVWAKESAIETILKGSPLYVIGVEKCDDGIVRGETVAVLSDGGKLVAIGIAKMDSSEIAKRKKGSAVRTDRLVRTSI
ncbi:MAG: RNA-guided pseudouridylation complex pseudouridine synthase subunit Cbf5 [Candidatus Aenigmarchaeota archaeon]|nr:RNA-guided pseudouridylation complex pseudouridine synthase subunit Cbf5 [Candidatus Aenigmarchaeota archaeon]